MRLRFAFPTRHLLDFTAENPCAATLGLNMGAQMRDIYPSLSLSISLSIYLSIYFEGSLYYGHSLMGPKALF